MILIVDANILFAALIKNGMTATLLLDDRIDCYAPQFIFDEFNKYREEIITKTKRSRDQFEQFLNFLKRRIIVIPKDCFVDFMIEARSLSPDPDDEAYFALALNLNGALWSNDKELKDKQVVVQVLSTSDLVDLLFGELERERTS